MVRRLLGAAAVPPIAAGELEVRARVAVTPLLK